VIGTNVRALRLGAGITLEQFSASARLHGLRWTSGRVGDLESGKITLSVETALTVAAVLASLLGREVGLDELVAGDDRVTGSGRIVVSAVAPAVIPMEASASVTAGFLMRDVDFRLCRELGVDREHGAAMMAALWGRPFSAQRDAIAGPESNAQQRGQVAKRLKADLQKAVNGDGNN
jgi:transcriptional regulator with XRE-family HTH domain